jgi:hypothetical protein
MMGGSGTEIFRTGLNVPSNRKADNDDNDDDDELTQSIQYFTGCML